MSAATNDAAVAARALRRFAATFAVLGVVIAGAGAADGQLAAGLMFGSVFGLGAVALLVVARLIAASEPTEARHAE